MKLQTALLGAFLILAMSCLANEGNESEVEDLASCVDLPHADNQTRSICDRNGKSFLILEFFIPSCPACIRNAPKFLELEQQVKDFAHTRFISSRDLRETRPFIDRFNITSDVALDPAGMAGRSYNIRQVPTTVVIDDQNRIIYRAVGLLDEEKIQHIVGLVSPRP